MHMHKLLPVLLGLAVLAPVPARATVPVAAVPVATPPSPILTTPEALDSETHARPAIARVTHVALDLAVDFEARVLRGTATLDLLAAPGARAIVLDDKGLVIESVRDGRGRALRWRVGAAAGEKGAPLTIRIGAARRIVIRYASQPQASALGWLPPALTAGKARPFLYSQGQAIENRSWIPTQDSPGIRQTWEARITVPEDLVAVMSGDRLTPQGEPAGAGLRRYRFRMDKPVPPYLIAIAVGDLAFRPLGPRTGVYAEPVTLPQVVPELDDSERMIAAAEQLYGPYRWGRFDIPHADDLHRRQGQYRCRRPRAGAQLVGQSGDQRDLAGRLAERGFHHLFREPDRRDRLWRGARRDPRRDLMGRSAARSARDPGRGDGAAQRLGAGGRIAGL
jgi:hypothetical protein